MPNARCHPTTQTFVSHPGLTGKWPPVRPSRACPYSVSRHSNRFSSRARSRWQTCCGRSSRVRRFSAVLLAVVGVYAVVAYQAHRRAREIGLRMALGAQRHQMWALVIRPAGLLGGIGVALGLGVSLAVSPALTVFADQAAFDIVPFLAASGVLVITAVVGAAIPARRAYRVNPMIALRIE